MEVGRRFERRQKQRTNARKIVGFNHSNSIEKEEEDDEAALIPVTNDNDDDDLSMRPTTSSNAFYPDDGDEMDGSDALSSTVLVLTRMRLSSLDPDWTESCWEAQFTACGELPRRYVEGVLEQTDMIKIMEKVTF